MRNWRLGLVLSVSIAGVVSVADLRTMEKGVEEQRTAVVEIADKLWREAELGYMKNVSSTVLCDYLTSNGFSI